MDDRWIEWLYDDEDPESARDKRLAIGRMKRAEKKTEHQTKKGTRFCIACQKTLQIVDFQYDQPNICITCKYNLDCIYKVCANQSKLERYHENRKDSDKLVIMVKNYANHRKAVQGGEAAGKWNIATVETEIAVQQGMQCTQGGELMCRRRFLEWVSDPKMCTWPKTLTREEADVRWSGWILDLPTSCPYLAYDVDFEVYIRVPTTTTLDFLTSLMRKNSVNAVVKQMKKPDKDAIERELSKLQMGLDKFGASDLQQNQTAMTMLKGGQTGEAFSDIAKTLPNITALVPEEASDDEEMQQDGKEEATEGGGQQRGEKRKSPEGENSPGTDAKKSKKYWYKDGYIAEKLHELDGLVATTTDEVEKVMAELHKLVTDMSLSMVLAHVIHRPL